MVESYGRDNLGAKGLVRGDILSGETYQRAPDFTRAVCVHGARGAGGHQGPENAKEREPANESEPR